MNLRDARINARLTQKQLADMIGVKHNTISDWENGRTSPDVDNIIQLCNKLRISADVLLGTESTDERLTLPESEHIKSYRGLDTHGKKVVDHLLESETARIKQEREAAAAYSETARVKIHTPQMPIEPKQPPMVEVEYYHDLPASAGTGTYLDDYCESEMREFPDEHVPYSTDFAVRISGDSMEPRIHDNDIVFVENTPTLRDGDTGIFWFNGDSYCKELKVDYATGDVFLVSLNDDYAPIAVHEYDEMRTFGRVLGRWSDGDDE